MVFAEYVWLDGSRPAQGIRSKTRIVPVDAESPRLTRFPDWTFDGALTGQAEGEDQDCALKPVCFVRDPLREGDHFLVLCEVFNPDGTRHPSSGRADLRLVLANGAEKHEPWIGFGQDYIVVDRDGASGASAERPNESGDAHYCGVGADRTFGREVAEEHARLCEEAGLLFYGFSARTTPARF